MIEVSYPLFQSKVTNYVRHLKTTGGWDKKDEQQEKIIALEATVQTLRGGLKMHSSRGTSSKPQSKSSRNKPPANSNKAKNKKNRSDRQRQRFHEEWRKKEPAPGEPHTKMVDGHEETWCVHHQLWQRHTSEECRKGKEQREASEQAHKVGHVSNSTYAQATKATSSMQALADLSRSD
jgi:hypothetical protein